MKAIFHQLGCSAVKLRQISNLKTASGCLALVRMALRNKGTTTVAMRIQTTTFWKRVNSEEKRLTMPLVMIKISRTLSRTKST